MTTKLESMLAELKKAGKGATARPWSISHYRPAPEDLVDIHNVLRSWNRTPYVLRKDGEFIVTSANNYEKLISALERAARLTECISALERSFKKPVDPLTHNIFERNKEAVSDIEAILSEGV